MSDPEPGAASEITPEVTGFVKTWAENISTILTQAANATFTLELLAAAPVEKPAADPHDLKLLVASTGAVRGEMMFNFTASAVVGLGQLGLGEPQNPSAEFKSEWRDTVLDLFREAGGSTAGTLTDTLGKVQMQTQACESVSWSPALTGWLGSAPGAPYNFTLEWQLSSALVASLRSSSNQETASKETVAQPANDIPEPDAGPPPKLELLMDVELDVVLRFGQRSMLLREILELDAGSVVDLDRKVSDTVELLVDGRVVARGDVVVVDGNYGLRILELG
jgi:flagellar motor switch protein FliN/FliY